MTTEVFADQSHLPVPPGFTPEGVDGSLFSDETLALIRQIPGGYTTFIHLLYYATLSPSTTMQRSLFAATGESSDEAIALISSIEALAKSPGSPFKSPDAYQRRLLALESLQIIRRVFHRTYTEIRIRLGKRTIHVPSLLASLWQLHEAYKDGKVKQLARKTAKRLKTGEFLTYANTTCTTLDPQLAPVLRVLDEILQARGLQEDPATLTSACTIIASALLPEKYGRVDGKMGEFFALLARTHPTVQKNTGESSRKMGEFVEGQTGREGQLQTSQEGPLDESLAGNSPNLESKSTKKRTIRLKKGEFQALFAINSPKLGGFGPLPEKTGESKPSVTISDHISPENITCNGEETLNDVDHSDSPAYRDPRPFEAIRREGRDLAKRLDGSMNSKWLAKLIQCIQLYPPHVRRLAEIDTLYHTAFPDYRGKPKLPGAWFARRCEEYVDPQWKVQDEIRRWDESGLNLVSINEELLRGRPIPSAALLFDEDAEQQAPDEHTDPVQGDGQQNSAVTWGDVQLTWKDQQYMQHHSLLHTRMDRLQADRLCERVGRETHTFSRLHGLRIDAKVRPGAREGEFLVVVDWDDEEVEIENEAEWSRYFQATKVLY